MSGRIAGFAGADLGAAGLVAVAPRVSEVGRCMRALAAGAVRGAVEDRGAFARLAGAALRAAGLRAAFFGPGRAAGFLLFRAGLAALRTALAGRLAPEEALRRLRRLALRLTAALRRVDGRRRAAARFVGDLLAMTVRLRRLISTL
jgi:hypothetical protein